LAMLAAMRRIVAKRGEGFDVAPGEDTKPVALDLVNPSVADRGRHASIVRRRCNINQARELNRAVILPPYQSFVGPGNPWIVSSTIEALQSSRRKSQRFQFGRRAISLQQSIYSHCTAPRRKRAPPHSCRNLTRMIAPTVGTVLNRSGDRDATDNFKNVVGGRMPRTCC
jgi:hypothetical protein